MDGRRNTIQRQLVLDAVRELNVHATAEQVYEYAVLKHPSISKATVYRNLSQLVESGELLNVGSFYGSARYDHNCRNHYHLICEGCKRVFDLDDYFPDICGRIKNMEGFDITSHNITFGGLCRECKSRRVA